jgi:hypothetical protein
MGFREEKAEVKRPAGGLNLPTCNQQQAVMCRCERASTEGMLSIYLVLLINELRVTPLF